MSPSMRHELATPSPAAAHLQHAPIPPTTRLFETRERMSYSHAAECVHYISTSFNAGSLLHRSRRPCACRLQAAGAGDRAWLCRKCARTLLYASPQLVLARSCLNPSRGFVLVRACMVRHGWDRLTRRSARVGRLSYCFFTAAATTGAAVCCCTTTVEGRLTPEAAARRSRVQASVPIVAVGATAMPVNRPANTVLRRTLRAPPRTGGREREGSMVRAGVVSDRPNGKHGRRPLACELGWCGSGSRTETEGKDRRGRTENDRARVGLAHLLELDVDI